MRIPIGNVHVALLGMSIPAEALGLYAALAITLDLLGGSDFGSNGVQEGALTAAVALAIAIALGGAGLWQARFPSNNYLLVERGAQLVTLVRSGEAPVSCSFLALGPVQLITRKFGDGRKERFETDLFAVGLGRASVLRALTDGQAIRRRKRILDACRPAGDPGPQIRDRLRGFASEPGGDPSDRSDFDELLGTLDEGSVYPAFLQAIDLMLEDPDLRLRTAAVKLVAERPDVASGLGIARLVHFLLWRPGYHHSIAPAGFSLDQPTLRDGIVTGVIHVLATGDTMAREVVEQIVKRGQVGASTASRFMTALGGNPRAAGP